MTVWLRCDTQKSLKAAVGMIAYLPRLMRAALVIVTDSTNRVHAWAKNV